MKHSRPFLEGTIILTISSLCSKCIGFYNRIFLSNFIGAHQMGIYQLIFPIYLVGFSVCFHGFETALSKLVSAHIAKKENQAANSLLLQTIKITFFLSLLFTIIVFILSEPICLFLLKEESCIPCLRIALIALPFVGIKGCIHSYTIGHGRPLLSALSLCFEQTIRVVSIYIISISCYLKLPVPALIAVFGMVFGEIMSCLFTVAFFLHSNFYFSSKPKIRQSLRPLLNLSIPLTCNSLCITALSSIEGILIPFMLTIFYENQHHAIEIYGIVTGMTLPFILFPSTITNALSVMLLPKVSAAWETANYHGLKRIKTGSIGLSLVIGIGSFFVFYFFGRSIGTTVFHQSLCGRFLQSMSFLCPFLYVSGTLTSILNGLGQTKITLLHNVISLSLRIAFILFVVPLIGINGYLLGLLTSSMVLVALHYKSILNF